MKSFISVAVLALASVVLARQLNVINKCSFTVWPGAYGNGLTNDQTGFELAPGASQVLNVPDNLSAFRIWGRTACTGSGSSLNCGSGDCDGRFQCSGITGQPATLVELTLGSQDYYDLSNVDGYSISMSITPTGSFTNPNPGSPYGCGTASCSLDPNSCAPELIKHHSDGTTSCLSICSAINDADQRAAFPILQGFYNDVNTATLLCCSCGPNCGAGCGCYTSSNCLYGCSPYATPGMGGVCDVIKWPLSSQGKQYNLYLKDPCPNAYSWPFDDNTSTDICVGANYDITFCP
ncbi:hypothetical protein BZG36_04353 [Bifiguratus adelaidae]|uniref:Osmotin, thaumatin-like protein n=1 Tax=Bifiguratus adelaidae TaxID=1938954 RepID=A0A261XWV1_9FUNG|nr:hypothetical protein BZG36_04353 [Bifiguratus adelaidae]